MDCRVPLGSLTVFAGVSGSGKSTLAFDTLYAEGQRRYVTSLSTYARQFLERLPRPDVDFISNLPPAIAIERRNRVTNARSTVGTATEIQDLLRLLFAKLGETWCETCGKAVRAGTVESVADDLLSRFDGTRLSVGAPLGEPAGMTPDEHRDLLLRDGYTRLLDSTGHVVDLEELAPRDFSRLRSDAWLLIDRLAVRRGDGRQRVAEAVAGAWAQGDGTCGVHLETGERELFHQGFVCDGCGLLYPNPEPSLLSFNSPLGACPECQGFGRVPALDPDRVVPDPSVSLADGAIAPFTSPSGAALQEQLLDLCADRGVPTDVPYASLSARDREWVFAGDGSEWRGVVAYFRRLERKRYKVQNRVLIARYRRYETCTACAGARLRPEALAVRLGKRDIAAVTAWRVDEVRDWLDEVERDTPRRDRAGRLFDDLRARLGTTKEVGLDYVTLDRPMRSLSGGEAQRIQLAAALGGALTASLYVLDEPSVGLHARDVERLIGMLRRIRDHGNTVVVVEHASEVVALADHVVELGPRAGRSGGRVVVEGPVSALLEHTESLTGRALRGEYRAKPRRARTATGRLRIVGARGRNLEGVNVDIPLGQLVAVTGVSGAGKSTLIRSVLVGQLRRDPERGSCERIEGAEQISEVVVVDPTPPARSTRSNPATVSKAFDAIRKRFAATPAAQLLGAKPGWFSFNVAGGRCEACEGSGEVVVDMQFLDDVRMPCEICDGLRYRPEALGVHVGGRSIADVLALTVDEACECFGDDRRIADRLDGLAKVGLGYITLGQPLSTLSSGETQRLRLAQSLVGGGEGGLFVMDEPTTGLHAADVEVLLACLDRVLDAGGSVVVVEHNLDVIERADHVIDLGPEGGPGGGCVVAEGSPAEIACCPDSHTGAALRRRGGLLSPVA